MELEPQQQLEQRLDEGMLDEVRHYLAAGGNPQHLHDLGLEYRFILRYLTGEIKGEAAFKEELARAIRQFTKRQVTWFKAKPYVQWVTCDTVADGKSIVKSFEDIVNNAKTLFK